MKKLFYGKEGDEVFYEDDEHLHDEADSFGENILCVLYEIDHKNGDPWCMGNSEGDPECNARCEDYQPCNGLKGKCRRLSKTLKPTGESYIIEPEYL